MATTTSPGTQGTTGGSAPRGRPGRRAWAAIAATVLVAAGAVTWLVVSGRGGDTPASSATPPSASATALPADWPHFLDLDTGHRTPLPTALAPPRVGLGTTFAVSPDGAWLAWKTCPLTPAGCDGPSEAALVRLDGSDRRVIPVAAGTSVGGIAWSPDGARIAFQQNEIGYTRVGELYVFDIATGERTQVTDIPLDTANWWSLTYDFTEDGQSLLYDLPRESSSPSTWDIWRAPITGGPAQKVKAGAKGPATIRGGGMLYQVPSTTDWGGRGIGQVTADGADRHLVDVEDGLGFLMVSPDATRVAYHDGGVRVLDLSTGAVTSHGDGSPAAWLDDHTLLVTA